MTEAVVVDASAVVELLLGTTRASAIGRRLDGAAWHAPAHVDAEVLSALGRLARAGALDEPDVGRRLELLAAMPLERHLLPAVLAGAWARRGDLRLVDALYVELAHQLDAPLITTDGRLARATSIAELVDAA